MGNTVMDYIEVQKNVYDYFQCKEDYLIKPLVGFRWRVIKEEGISFFTYWTHSGVKKDAVVVKKNGVPQVFKTKDYTMVIAIDCIKIAFIMKNTDRQY